jgi:ergothioneine biosynthesis protein EgtB
MPSIAPIVALGQHHEQQHQELILTNLKHMLSRNPLHPVYVDRAPNPALDVGPRRWGSIFPSAWIGHAASDFAFDNEQPRHREFVPAFRLASCPVTNAEYLVFMEDGGDMHPELWLSMGWATVQQEGWRAPLDWQNRDDTWWTFTLSGLHPVYPAEPVSHISYFEADACARWAEARLHTEAEWTEAEWEVRP